MDNQIIGQEGVVKREGTVKTLAASTPGHRTAELRLGGDGRVAALEGRAGRLGPAQCQALGLTPRPTASSWTRSRVKADPLGLCSRPPPASARSRGRSTSPRAQPADPAPFERIAQGFMAARAFGALSWPDASLPNSSVSRTTTGQWPQK